MEAAVEQWPRGGGGVIDTGARPPASLAEELAALERVRGFDVRGTLAAARALRERASVAQDDVAERRALLVEADMLDRLGDTSDSVRLVWDVHEWALRRQHGGLRARTHRLLSSVFQNLGDAPSGLEHAISAMEALDEEEPEVVRQRFVTMLADALATAGSYDSARERYEAAERDLQRLGEMAELVHVLNNHAYTEYEAGDLRRADQLVTRLLTVAETHGVGLTAAARETVASIRVAQGRYAEAVEVAEQAMDFLATGRFEEIDLQSEHALMLTLAKARRLLGDYVGADLALQGCLAESSRRGIAAVYVGALEEAAAAAAEVGDFERAYQLHVVFHAESEALRSREREVAARTSQAIFETTEAREAAQRFREQAMRDPLTGLFNRRYFDDQVNVLLALGEPGLSMGLLDLDHFKSVNDDFSHETGDKVLVTVSRVLERVVSSAARGTPRPFVARLGGEEFALVLPGLDAAAAVELCERIRLVVAEHPWSALLDDRVQTVSIGVAQARAGSSVASLLREADASLYAAKESGRDAVVYSGSAVPRRAWRDIIPMRTPSEEVLP
ncbi:diguanylate cyclase (GGDEF)-like protein [Motilibacter rhizosphaerae]|uniref:Diguanylate cyclase (GGDEF)-like protein n=1 Tax=Motilibacter rhizosphaerae TaxID=598652 RepID=A0A4Q7NSY6_9ACTN|nr:GGDEF domain-containing protein [Motilibacter rhizosphaerae]RZS89492.1 diguanylate cyclase (GGDEF)-like protein [Motilibacter rhizosphaerae]